MIRSIVVSIVTGILIGGVARGVMTSGRSIGVTPLMVVGVVGAVLGRFAARMLFGNSMFLGMILAIGGALAGVALYRAIADG